MNLEHKIGVIIPTFKARSYILNVISLIGAEVDKIYIVDDCCPENSGDYVKKNCFDQRVVVISHGVNQGVGAAVITGYLAAVKDGMEILVKIDSDGQMDPSLIMDFVAPIALGRADYTKGNRFYDLEAVRSMPKLRLWGNAALSLICKLSSGYWNLFDPTNGYTAIHADIIHHLPIEKISKRYFFESDMLFRLNTIRAVVADVPMEARYGNEVSNLKISKVIGEFMINHTRNFLKRIFYNYYLRDMSLASIELPLGLMAIFFGLIYGGYYWLHSTQTGISASAGTVMLAALPLLMGTQLILAFINYDISSAPKIPRHKLNYGFKK